MTDPLTMHERRHNWLMLAKLNVEQAIANLRDYALSEHVAEGVATASVLEDLECWVSDGSRHIERILWLVSRSAEETQEDGRPEVCDGRTDAGADGTGELLAGTGETAVR
jgi:hypothetical protein